ncbi:MAG: allantoicase [Alphaproteobacteria bacterium]|nr:allantoicase [Alphaproteobacteria bacterium]
MTPSDIQLPDFATNATNLASKGLGARGVSVTDEFFAPLERMLEDRPAIFIEDKYDDHGKWMDGWESRRRRTGGHDHATVRLAVPGVINGFDIDTSHFTGNYPPQCAIEAASLPGGEDPVKGDDTVWTQIVARCDLGPDRHHFVPSASSQVFTHVRVHIYPDGGLARLRVYGTPHLDLKKVAGTRIDLASALNGGRVLAWSDAHYGQFRRILAPGRGRDMGDGWETRRRRGPGNDWMIIALGAPGVVSDIQVDTAHYKGNYPHSCAVQGTNFGAVTSELDEAEVAAAENWPLLLEKCELGPDRVHDFDHETLVSHGPVTHVRLAIFPDGGISRLRIFGKVVMQDPIVVPGS